MSSCWYEETRQKSFLAMFSLPWLPRIPFLRIVLSAFIWESSLREFIWFREWFALKGLRIGRRLLSCRLSLGRWWKSLYPPWPREFYAPNRLHPQVVRISTWSLPFRTLNWYINFCQAQWNTFSADSASNNSKYPLTPHYHTQKASLSSVCKRKSCNSYQSSLSFSFDTLSLLEGNLRLQKGWFFSAWSCVRLFQIARNMTSMIPSRCSLFTFVYCY
jgi:hypothetical protein